MDDDASYEARPLDGVPNGEAAAERQNPVIKVIAIVFMDSISKRLLRVLTLTEFYSCHSIKFL